MVHLDKEPFIGQRALREEQKRGGAPRRLVGLEIHWPEVEKIYERVGLAPQAPTCASRVAVPVFSNGSQVGKATSTAWSPLLKKMIALASVRADCAFPGTTLQMEITVEAVHYPVGVTVKELPFFNPPRKSAALGA